MNFTVIAKIKSIPAYSMSSKLCYLLILLLSSSCGLNKTWKKHVAVIPENLHDIETLTEETMIVYGYGSGNMYKTCNSGKSWSKIFQFDSIYFEQIQFLNESEGWIVGSPDKLYSTVDGGMNWSDKSLQLDSNAFIYGMWFDSSLHGYIAVLKRSKTNFSTVLLQTQNGGVSWEQINTIDEMILNIERIDGVLYATGNNVVLQNIDKTNWSYLFRDTTGVVGQIRYIDKSESGQILVSSLNGFIVELNENSNVLRRITKNRIRCLVWLSNDNWIAAGDKNIQNGNLFLSVDNGCNWKIVSNDFPDIHRIAKSNSKVWLVGKRGLIVSKSF